MTTLFNRNVDVHKRAPRDPFRPSVRSQYIGDELKQIVEQECVIPEELSANDFSIENLSAAGIDLKEVNPNFITPSIEQQTNLGVNAVNELSSVLEQQQTPPTSPTPTEEPKNE